MTRMKRKGSTTQLLAYLQCGIGNRVIRAADTDINYKEGNSRKYTNFHRAGRAERKNIRVDYILLQHGSLFGILIGYFGVGKIPS